MEGSSAAQTASLPRLRLSRQPFVPVAGHSDTDEDAGPSRHPQQQQDLDDTQPTPRINNIHATEPADRLRALLALTKSPRPPSPSDVESDFEPPRFSPRESLKDMFSRVLADTPTKRVRRGSTSEVEEGPSSGKPKGKRKSLSDEEASFSQHTAETTSSQAATYDTLRAKLDNSHTPLKHQPVPSAFYDTSNADVSAETAGSHFMEGTQPMATSTPPHSLEISQNSKFQATNLMDNDSEMDHFIKDLDSYEGDSGPNSRPSMWPSSVNEVITSQPLQSHSLLPADDRLAQDRLLLIGSHSMVPLLSLVPGPSLVTKVSPLPRFFVDSTDWIEVHDSPDHLHDLERKWNQHHLKPTDKNHSPMVAVNGHVRARTRSSSSLHSLDSGGSSSRGTSTTSQSDYKERMMDFEKEKAHEREQGWNKRYSLHASSTSSLLPPVERTRKLSHPSRPGSSLSLHSPSRGASPASAATSPTTSDEEERVHHEIDHERERNWNAPKPKWGKHERIQHAHHRSPSPLPASPVASTSRPERSRVDSLTRRATPKGESLTVARVSPVPTSTSTLRHVRSKSSILSPTQQRPLSYPARPNSPLPPLQTPSKFAGQSVTQLTSPEPEPSRSRLRSSPSPVISTRPANSANRHSMSHIPVLSRSPMKPIGKAPANGLNRPVAEFPPHTVTPSIVEPPMQSDMEDPPDAATPEDDGTPVAAPVILPKHSPSPSPPRRIATPEEDVQLQKALSIPPPPSPPPSPPHAEPQIAEPPTMLSLLSTPPRRPSFHNSKLDFKTPSPPHDLPELPEPSSSDEDTETERQALTPLRFSEMTMKTPKPPGGWYTPAKADSESDSQYEGGLATPGPSLSRASAFPAVTPHAPGGWINTPMRKSVLQVRFDEKPSELELSATEESVNGHSEEVSDIGLATPVEEKDHFNERPPETPPPVSPAKSPRRSPTIHFVDAFGRSTKPSPKQSRKSKNSLKNRKNSVRYLDAMGQETKTEIKEEVMVAPLDKSNALNFVRNGVSDLASGLDDMDLSADMSELDKERILELNNESRAARAARNDLEEAYRRQSAQLRASMLRSKLAIETVRSPSPRIWLWSILIMSQALFIFLLYRYQTRKVHELYLTTYYDPLYPDLHHIYGNKYDLFAIPRTVTSIRTLSNTFWQEGLWAVMGNLFDTGGMILSQWQRDAWRRWGAQDIPWPPT
ncbi:hypothetical protein MIND_00040500 [Mycena indigotica]|uniref:Uncharacterized protein n=1 Tax=Mycena indigotica TaxID=2126181 RepID=A0A8H6TD64_9AGAR|nr:uncharacterized protein MIND_00040500 [Mycena indigotica]KAF7315261.1 hypothetical protein MIND_00040500 [Mycena indigotica]